MFAIMPFRSSAPKNQRTLPATVHTRCLILLTGDLLKTCKKNNHRGAKLPDGKKNQRIEQLQHGIQSQNKKPQQPWYQKGVGTGIFLSDFLSMQINHAAISQTRHE
jgi:hypothetical protein